MVFFNTALLQQCNCHCESLYSNHHLVTIHSYWIIASHSVSYWQSTISTSPALIFWPRPQLASYIIEQCISWTFWQNYFVTANSDILLNAEGMAFQTFLINHRPIYVTSISTLCCGALETAEPCHLHCTPLSDMTNSARGQKTLNV